MNHPDDRLRLDIKGWLMAEGWEVSERDHEQARWILVGEDSRKRRVLVAQARFPPEQIRIQATVEVSELHRQHFAALPPQVRESVLWEIRLRLLGMHVEFSGVGEPLERVHLNQRIYLDGLSRDALMQRVSEIKDAMICVIWLTLRHLGNEPPPPGRGDFLVH
jgi:hypothetical protein